MTCGRRLSPRAPAMAPQLAALLLWLGGSEYTPYVHRAHLTSQVQTKTCFLQLHLSAFVELPNSHLQHISVGTSYFHIFPYFDNIRDLQM